MKRFVFFAGVILIVIPVAMHAGWTRTYGGAVDDIGYCVEQTRDLGYIICGTSGQLRWNLIKTNQTGDTLWTYHSRQSHWVQQTSDRGYIITGEALIEDGRYHLYLEKIDSSGNELWYRDDLNGVGYSVQQTSDGGYIITGHKSLWLDEEIGDLWLIKTDSTGDTIWTRTYGAEGPDWGHCVRETSDGGYIIAGYTSTDWSLWVLKTDANGDTVWTSGLPFSWYCRGYSVLETSDDGYIIIGSGVPLEDGKEHVIILKIDSGGNTIWTKMEDGWFPDNVGGAGRCIEETSDGNYILTGYTSEWIDEINDLFLIKVDPEGDTLWVRIYGGEAEDLGYCVDQTTDGGYIITGATKSFGAGGYDLWLLRTDANGDTVGIAEQPPVTHPSNWRISASIGRQIILQYSNMPQGFDAQIFDVSGRKVDELHSAGSSGTITWGSTASPGVYFIKPVSVRAFEAQKVVLLR